MMDIWMIVSLSLPFLEVILHTIIDSLQYKIKTATILKVIRFFAVYGIICCYLLFLVLFFSIGLWHRDTLE